MKCNGFNRDDMIIKLSVKFDGDKILPNFNRRMNSKTFQISDWDQASLTQIQFLNASNPILSWCTQSFQTPLTVERNAVSLQTPLACLSIFLENCFS